MNNRNSDSDKMESTNRIDWSNPFTFPPSNDWNHHPPSEEASPGRDIITTATITNESVQEVRWSSGTHAAAVDRRNVVVTGSIDVSAAPIACSDYFASGYDGGKNGASKRDSNPSPARNFNTTSSINNDAFLPVVTAEPPSTRKRRKRKQQKDPPPTNNATGVTAAVNMCIHHPAATKKKMFSGKIKRNHETNMIIAKAAVNVTSRDWNNNLGEHQQQDVDLRNIFHTSQEMKAVREMMTKKEHEAQSSKSLSSIRQERRDWNQPPGKDDEYDLLLDMDNIQTIFHSSQEMKMIQEITNQEQEQQHQEGPLDSQPRRRTATTEQTPPASDWGEIVLGAMESRRDKATAAARLEQSSSTSPIVAAIPADAALLAVKAAFHNNNRRRLQQRMETGHDLF